MSIFKKTPQDLFNACGVDGNLKNVQQCIEKENMDVNLRDPSENDTPLIKAAYWARYDICNYLLEKGADINAKDSSMGFTALHYAAWRGSFNHIRIVKLLLEKGADPSIRSRVDTTPYHAALEKDHKNIILAFKEKGIDENTHAAPTPADPKNQNQTTSSLSASSSSAKGVKRCVCGASVKGSNTCMLCGKRVD